MGITSQTTMNMRKHALPNQQRQRTLPGEPHPVEVKWQVLTQLRLAVLC